MCAVIPVLVAVSIVRIACQASNRINSDEVAAILKQVGKKVGVRIVDARSHESRGGLSLWDEVVLFCTGSGTSRRHGEVFTLQHTEDDSNTLVTVIVVSVDNRVVDTEVMATDKQDYTAREIVKALKDAKVRVTFTEKREGMVERKEGQVCE